MVPNPVGSSGVVVFWNHGTVNNPLLNTCQRLQNGIDKVSLQVYSAVYKGKGIFECECSRMPLFLSLRTFLPYEIKTISLKSKSKGACIMTKKEIPSVPQVDFKDLTPEMLLIEEKPDALYEKAFLSREDKSATEYAENTTTWD